MSFQDLLQTKHSELARQSIWWYSILKGSVYTLDIAHVVQAQIQLKALPKIRNIRNITCLKGRTTPYSKLHFLIDKLEYSIQEFSDLNWFKMSRMFSAVLKFTVDNSRGFDTMSGKRIFCQTAHSTKLHWGIICCRMKYDKNPKRFNFPHLERCWLRRSSRYISKSKLSAF